MSAEPHWVPRCAGHKARPHVGMQGAHDGTQPRLALRVLICAEGRGHAPS